MKQELSIGALSVVGCKGGEPRVSLNGPNCQCQVHKKIRIRYFSEFPNLTFIAVGDWLEFIKFDVRLFF